MADSLITKLGKTRAGECSRVWIEGARLQKAGFIVGVTFHKTWDEEARTLELKTRVPKDAPRTDVGTVTGKGDKPIIDIIGSKVIETFAGCSHVRATYHKGRILIERVAS